jgi:uncharacterized RDD family membrane protein YckC
MEYEEYVAYEPQLARRVAAALLDYTLFFGIMFGYATIFGEPLGDGQFYVHGFGNLFAVALLWFLYFPVMEGLWGFTLFKGLFDLKVVSDRRRDLDVGVALKRHLFDPIDFFMFGLVAIILVKTSDEHQRIGDLVANTRVILDKEEGVAP